MSLFQISTELFTVLDAMEKHGADSPELEAALAAHSEGLSEGMDRKAEQYADLITALDARATARIAESERVAALAKSDATLSGRLRERLMQAMVLTGKEKIETDRYRLSVRTNGGSQPVEIENPDDIPALYRIPKTTETIDKKGILEALSSGKPVPGARLLPRGKRLNIS